MADDAATILDGLGKPYVRSLRCCTYVLGSNMGITASKLRENVYRILDDVLATGVPVEIERNGRVLRIMAVDGPSTADRLVRRPDVVVGDSEDFVHLDWSADWNP